MEITEHIARLEADGPALARAAQAAGLDAAVPATDWTVRDLVTHAGGIHRWAADIVSSRSATGDTAAGRAVGQMQSDDALLDWFIEGHAELVRVLRTASPDLECFTFLAAPSPLAFWARRQAHETAVHRGDAERAASAESAFDTDFAQDGIDELLNGFARRKNNAIATAATLVLRTTDAGDDWTITLGGDRIAASRAGAASADATVSGSSGDLYQWLWNRPAAVRLDGDPEVAELWRTVQVRWG